MKQKLLRQTAFLFSGVLTVMTACTAPSSIPPLSESNTKPQQVSSTTVQAPAAEKTVPDFTYRESVNAARRAEEYFYEYMDGPQRDHYAILEYLSASTLPYSEYSANEELQAMLSFTAKNSGKTHLERLTDGEVLLVRVHFYVEYQPEANYLGMQYLDGLNAVYILVPVDEAKPCEWISSWHSEQPEGYAPRRIEEADALGLTTYQYRMLVHQCHALAAAGLRDFASPKDWSEKELYAYLYYRAQDFDIEESAWQSENPSGYANKFLTIDFTSEDDWSMNTRFLPQDWPGFSKKQIRTYNAELESLAVPGYDSTEASWQFFREGEEITAQLTLPGGKISQTYTFAVHEGFDAFTVWNGRTYCVKGYSSPVA